jgi:23S rRNA G2445 N2-methylase RlmL
MQIIDGLRLAGSGGANRTMEAEFKRLVVRSLGSTGPLKPVRLDPQNLRYPFDPGLAWCAVHYARTPSRVLWDLVELDAQRLEPLYEEVRDFVAEAPAGWLADGLGLSVEVKGVKAFPAGPLQIRGTIKNGLVDGARDAGVRLALEPEDPDLCFIVQEFGERLVLSLDLAGQSLHRRGYRLSTSDAPLKENLAAQLLMLARWDPRSEALVDPMMGGATIPVEGALMAAGAPLWQRHTPAAHRLPAFAPWAERPRPDLFPGRPPAMFGNDVDGAALRAAKDNSARARVDDRLVLIQGTFHDLSLARLERGWRDKGLAGSPDLSRGLVVCNPPYGERVGYDEDILIMYDELVAWGLSLGPGWRFCFLAGHPGLERAIRAQPRLKKPMSNGPIKAHVLVYDGLE